MILDDLLSSIYSDDLSEDHVSITEEVLKRHGLLHLLRETVVDLGCGSGRILHLIKQKYGGKVVGIDRRPTKLYPDVYYLTEDMRHTSIPDKTISLVISVNIADFLDQSLTAEQIFKEVHRILRDGGVYLPGAIEQVALGFPYECANYRPILWGYQK